jgi:hypothetical protein
LESSWSGATIRGSQTSITFVVAEQWLQQNIIAKTISIVARFCNMFCCTGVALYPLSKSTMYAVHKSMTAHLLRVVAHKNVQWVLRY